LPSSSIIDSTIAAQKFCCSIGVRILASVTSYGCKTSTTSPPQPTRVPVPGSSRIVEVAAMNIEGRSCAGVSEVSRMEIGVQYWNV